MPFPDRGLTKRYRKRYDVFHEGRKALVCTSVGCPYRCNFCTCWKMTDGQYALRSPQSVVDEIAAVEEDYVAFADDNTFDRVDRATEMVELIKQRGIRKHFGGYARSDTIARNPELFRKWSEIGLDRLIIGYEAVTDEGLRRLNKRSSMDDNDRAIAILKQYGIVNMAHFAVRQDFTREDFEALWRYVEERDLWMPFFTVLTPLPGSDQWAEVREQVLTESFDLFDLGHSVLPTKLAQDEFLSGVFGLWRRNYSPLRYARKRLSQLGRLLKGKLPDKSTREIVPLVWLLLMNVLIRLAMLKIRRNHHLYLRPATAGTH
jgi:radical SAM superfamily enzyme YgiQ (UPF0313 family)